MRVGATSDIGKGILKAMNDLVKLVPSGTVSNASERNMLDQAKMQNTQNSAIQQQLRQQAVQQRGTPGGAPGGAPAGGPPSMGAAA